MYYLGSLSERVGYEFEMTVSVQLLRRNFGNNDFAWLAYSEQLADVV